jgi:anti-anti-sigma factor
MLIVALCPPADDCVVVEVSGELDAFNCGLLTETLEQAVARGTGTVIVDLGRVDYFSAAGLHCLEHASEAAVVSACSLRLVCAAGSTVLQILGATGTSGRWPVHPDVGHARRAGAAASRATR